MSLSKPRSEKEKEAIEIEKIAWIFVCEDYEELRKCMGCAFFTNLTAVKKDLEAILKIVDAMGIPDDTEHRIVHINPSRKELMQAFKTIARIQARHFDNNIPVFGFVYFGGHGLSHKSK